MSWLSKIFNRPKAVLDIIDYADLATPIYVVGDVHGRLDLLRALEARIAEAETTPVHILLLGDFIDRGPDSAGVIDHLLRPAGGAVRSRRAIRGNHEDMMLRFMGDPVTNQSWLKHGGAETLASYGVYVDPDAPEPPQRLIQRLAAHLPEDHLKALQNLPFLARAPGYVMAHAGIDPGMALEQQDPWQLMWGDPARSDGAGAGPLVIHGHVALDTPLILPRRINVDTGAWQTGRLTSVRISEKHAPSIVQV